MNYEHFVSLAATIYKQSVGQLVFLPGMVFEQLVSKAVTLDKQLAN